MIFCKAETMVSWTNNSPDRGTGTSRAQAQQGKDQTHLWLLGLWCRDPVYHSLMDLFALVFVFLETKSCYSAKKDMELALYPGVALGWSSYLSLSNARVTCLGCHAQFHSFIFWVSTGMPTIVLLLPPYWCYTCVKCMYLWGHVEVLFPGSQ